MKRKKIEYPILDTFKPIFGWHECRVCGCEFKREDGLIVIWENGRTVKCCSDCKEKLKKAYENSIKNRKRHILELLVELHKVKIETN